MAKKIMFNDRYGLTQAVLSGHKTMTRRIIKSRNMIARHWNPAFNADHCYYTDERGKCQLIDDDTDKIIIPLYKVGEVVAIAQSYKEVAQGGYPVDARYDAFRTANWGDGEDGALKSSAGWNNKMFVKSELMPHSIRITDVKVERLQDISDEDCIKEGIWKANNVCFEGVTYWYHGLINSTFRTAREAFAALIDKVSGKGVWDSNPYVFVYEFELVD